MIRKIVQMGDIVVKKVSSANNLANPFTKTLMERVFYGHRDNIGVRCDPSML